METSVECSSQESYKRKRKKSFLKNARKYGKRGYYGRGCQLDAETYNYFIRIMEVYKEGFSSDEEQSMLVNNVFAQTENQEINCSSNQVGCRVIQQLLPFANDYYLERYMDAFVSNLRPLACDRFASHVLQTLLEVSYKKYFSDKTDNEFREKCNGTVIKISRFLLNNLEDYVWDAYGNHVIRTVFINLAQLQVEDANAKKSDTCVVIKSEIETPEEFVEIVKDYAVRLIAWPQFSDFAYSELTSGLLQQLLKALKKLDEDLLKVYLKKLIKECFMKGLKRDDEIYTNEKNTLPEIFLSKPLIMLLECALEVASKKLFNRIFAKCFKNKLVLMATTRNTNFAVQKLLSHCYDKEMFEAMFDEVAQSFQHILEAGHSGVVLALAQTCKRLVARQGIFIQNMLKLLNCYEPEDRQNSIVMCLCKLIKFEDLPKIIDQEFTGTKLNLHGVLIIQLMLEFNKPIKIVNSILSNNPVNLKSIFLNTMGSHIVDSYMNSKFVGENSREKLVRLMQGTYQELSSSKYGSRSFEAIWNAVQLKQRLIIMNELSYKDALWSNSEYGKIIAGKTNLPLYKKNIEEWKNSFNKMPKKT